MVRAWWERTAALMFGLNIYYRLPGKVCSHKSTVRIRIHPRPAMQFLETLPVYMPKSPAWAGGDSSSALSHGSSMGLRSVIFNG